VDVRNKKGNSSLWLAANGGHLDVVQLLYSAGQHIRVYPSLFSYSFSYASMLFSVLFLNDPDLLLLNSNF
jgi:hypothetical protein